MRLEGKTALVTGGTRSIGRGISMALAREGAKVAMNYVSDDEAAEWTLNRFKKEGWDGVAIKADVGETEQCRELVKKANEAFGHIDILISNAAIGQKHSIIETPDEEWDHVMNVNVRATFALARELMPGMIERQFGRVVVISSNAATTGTASASFVGYGTSKAAIIALAKGIAHEGAPYITANAVCPGGTHRETSEERGVEWPPPISYEKRSWLGRPVLLNRLATPEDVSETILFLVSDSGCYINGQTIHISGGQIMP